ncbi:hypothetical protein [Paenibacillus harenae]|uniref:hypothetical protein n=1 Tax=Paenibacillus harenae TaxID=306543 RepID=UPI0027D88D37|nr:hypothetical protein [Paenibacillus harenae]
MRELLRWALKHGQGFEFSPKEARRLLGKDRTTIYKYLDRFRSLELIEPVAGGQRIRSYRLTDKALKLYP